MEDGKIEPSQLCSKIVILDKWGQSKAIFGLILSDSENEITVQTRNNIYKIPKKNILNIEETNIIFQSMHDGWV